MMFRISPNDGGGWWCGSCRHTPDTLSECIVLARNNGASLSPPPWKFDVLNTYASIVFCDGWYSTLHAWSSGGVGEGVGVGMGASLPPRVHSWCWFSQVIHTCHGLTDLVLWIFVIFYYVIRVLYLKVFSHTGCSLISCLSTKCLTLCGADVHMLAFHWCA